MSTWAQVQGGKVVMLTTADPAGKWDPGLVFVGCPDGTALGASYNGTSFVAPVAPPVVPPQVPNASARRVMQSQFTPSGQSFYTVIQGYLQGQVTATASQPDNAPTKIAALGAWTQWDMGNFFLRADPLVAAMGQVIAGAGGTVDLDALFVAAGAL